MSEMDISAINEEITKLKAQLESIKAWLRRRPDAWVNLEQLTATQQMVEDMKEWLREIPNEWLTDSDPLAEDETTVWDDPGSECDELKVDFICSVASTLRGSNATSVKETEDEIAPLPREYDKLETSVGEEVYAENIEIEKECEYHDDAIEIKTLEIIQQTEVGEFEADIKFECQDEFKNKDLKEESDGDAQFTDDDDFEPTWEKRYKKRKTTCKICHKSVTNLHQHLKVHETGRVKLTCEVCHKELSTARNLELHMRQHTGNYPLICPVCGKGMNALAILNEHIKRHSTEKSHFCAQCGKGFVMPADLAIHMSTHNTEENHKCTVCGKLFRSLRRLSCHNRFVHEKRGSYKCEECNKTYVTEGRLKKHMRRHREKLSHVCCHCQKGFKNKTALMNHTRVHTGERPFLCKDCGKSFRTGTNLRTHAIIHTGEKPHKCPACDKGFTQIGNMKIHLKTHDKESEN